MLWMPALAAFFRQAPAESESRVTIMRTATPSLIIASQMVPNLVLSPPAFWMSDWKPASVNAFCRLGRSLASQRGEVVVSGRITPIFLPLVLPPVDPEPEPPPLLLPQAAMPSTRAAAATIGSARHFLPELIDRPFAVAVAVTTITPYVVLCNIAGLPWPA